jgi:pimeloyl-ACP methyl ester carboxylesterase
MNNVIQFLIDQIGKNTVAFAGSTVDGSLQLSKAIVNTTLGATGELLKVLSNIEALPKDWRDNLSIGFQNIESSAITSTKALEHSIEVSRDAFEIAQDSMNRFKNHSIDLIYDNRYVSSVIGSAHDSKIQLSEIKMSFRENGKDIGPEDVWRSFENSGKEEIVLFVPGLFTDEYLWKDHTIEIDGYHVVSRGVSDHCLPNNVFPVYVRFNHGRHISENGKELLELVLQLLKHRPDLKINIIAYSLGCLVVRSLLYYSREKGLSLNHRNVKKVVFVSSPDGGSYLEKAGFWLGFLLEKTPYLVLQIIGVIGNMRSDAIKDLSHGIIREEDWVTYNPLTRYWGEKYFGELDGIDCYQFYSSYGEGGTFLQNWLGDGIVEYPSLIYLRDKVFLKKDKPHLRSVELSQTNHFTILQSGVLISKVKEIMHS